MTDQYVDKKTVDASYRPKSSQMSPGLKRARQPFFLRNIITGIVLAGFSVGVWAYSIGAVKQDDFTDVDEEARALGRSQAQSVPVVEKGKEAARTPEAERKSAAGASGITPLPTAPPTPTISHVVESRTDPGRPRGLVAGLLAERYPGLFDPTTKTLIWGAPPVDRIGKVADPSPSKWIAS